MIQEAYCSKEVSKLLKEKGFNEICRAAYTGGGKFITHHNYYSQGGGDECVAPTHQMVMRWLREEHNIKIMIRPYVDGTYSYEILNGFWYVNFDSYEDAAEAAIKYCLEYLI